MQIANRMRDLLQARFRPVRLEIVDESHRHAGHAGARPEGETHFRVVITSMVFENLSRVQRQRLVYDCLGDLLSGPIHALSLRTSTPSES